MSKWMKLTVVLALALILFLVGKEKGWFKMKPTGNKVSDNPAEPTGTTGTSTTTTPTNTGTGTTTVPRTTGGTTTGTTPKPKNIPGFNPKEQANKLYSLLNKLWDWYDEDEEAFDILLSYTTEKLIAVNSAWREIFPPGRNMYDYINSEVVGQSRVTVLEKKMKILKTMRNLGLDKTP
ncbi:hypothetical protein [Haliscomenobacter sp.]|uniref:hypothetical protein n=1 Tax=Haliscomenobacter sp. TaxID=2717303 RepID=UPI003BAB8222